MCKSNTKLKLCTCGDVISETTPHWVLFRKDLETRRQAVPLAVGQPSSMLDDDALVSFLMEAEFSRLLSDIHFFDFEYTPIEGDFLYIKVAAYELAFQYVNNSWSRGKVSDQSLMNEMQRVLQGRVVKAHTL
jgi:hypothetical protein